MEHSNKAWIDKLRVSAALAVIFIHCSAMGMFSNASENSADWHACNFFNAFSRWSVPVFVMISGYLLLRKPFVSFQHFYVHRMKRLLGPIIFWIGFYVTLKIGQAKLSGTPFSITEILVGISTSEYVVHLWYIFMLVGLMAVTPLLQQVQRKLSIKFFIAVGVAFTILSFAITIVGTFVFNIETMYHIEGLPFFCWFIAYINYMVWGHIIGRSSNPRFIWGTVMLFVCFALLTVYLYHYLVQVGLFYVTSLVYSFYGPLAFATAICLFHLFHVGAPFRKMNRTISFLSPLTLGIYLCHPPILHGVVYAFTKIPGVDAVSAWLLIPLQAAIVFVLAAGVVVTMKKIPILKKTV